MRIIAGTHRGRQVIGPADAEKTRPITDRVKESLFNRLMAADRLDGAVVADLFSGTGSMGLECLSRGAEQVSFVERDRDAVDRLKQNLDVLHETEQAKVLAIDALGAGVVDVLAAKPCTLVFVDPPYAMMHQTSTFERITQQIQRLGAVVVPGAWLILRTDEHAPAPAVEGWDGPDSYRYGSMMLHIYRHNG